MRQIRVLSQFWFPLPLLSRSSTSTPPSSPSGFFFILLRPSILCGNLSLPSLFLIPILVSLSHSPILSRPLFTHCFPKARCLSQRSPPPFPSPRTSQLRLPLPPSPQLSPRLRLLLRLPCVLYFCCLSFLPIPFRTRLRKMQRPTSPPLRFVLTLSWFVGSCCSRVAFSSRLLRSPNRLVSLRPLRPPQIPPRRMIRL